MNTETKNRESFEKELVACIKGVYGTSEGEKEEYPITVMYKETPEIDADGNEIYTVLVGASESTAGYSPTEVDESIFPANCKIQYASYNAELENTSDIDVWIVPNGITEISPCAFHGVKIKGKVIISGTVEEIGATAFAECEGITAVEIQNGVKTINMEAFCGTGISEITLPDTLEYISDYAFTETPLKEVKLPKHLLNMKPNAFADCGDITFC